MFSSIIKLIFVNIQIIEDYLNSKEINGRA